MKKILLSLLIFNYASMQAQEVFHPTVKIEYEKVVYVQQQYKELFSEWYDRFKENIPIKVINYYEFIGDTTHSIFRRTKEAQLNPRSWYQSIADNNTVYNDYSKGKTITQKPVYEETFLIEDSLTSIRWKMTNDTRTIAGYPCRKAVGFIADTITVFAFYTDEILINGGPESVHGLPGMILGIGVPRLHTTWFATKVEVNGINTAAITPLSKGKKVNRKGMLDALGPIMKNWGKYGSTMLMNFVL